MVKWDIFACLLKEEISLNYKALCLSFEGIELMFAYPSWLLQHGEVQGQLLRLIEIGFMENLRQGGILINIYWRDMSLDVANESLDKIINIWVVLLCFQFLIYCWSPRKSICSQMFGSRNMFNRKVEQLNPSKPTSDKSARKISGSPVELSYQSIGVYFQGRNAICWPVARFGAPSFGFSAAPVTALFGIVSFPCGLVCPDRV